MVPPSAAHSADPPDGPGEEDPNARSILLMAEVAKGDEKAFQELVEMHQSAVIGTVAKMLNNATDGHDIAQQVFVRVWKSAARYRPEAKFTTWLFTITRNLVFNEMRKRKRRGEVSMDAAADEYNLEAPDDPKVQPDAEALQNELERAVDRAIEALPEKQRMAVVLRRYENVPYEELGSILDISVPAVKSLLFRARTELRANLKKYLDDEGTM